MAVAVVAGAHPYCRLPQLLSPLHSLLCLLLFYCYNDPTKTVLAKTAADIATVNVAIYLQNINW